MNEDMEKMLQEAPAPTLTLEPLQRKRKNRQLWKKKKRCSRLMKKKK